MKKMYCIISHWDNLPQGLFGQDNYGTNHWPNFPNTRLGDLSEDQQREVFASLSAVIGNTPAKKVLTNEDGRLFNRKDARSLAETLNDNGSWQWAVVEIGDATPRDHRPVIRWGIRLRGCKDESFETRPDGYGRKLTTRKEARAVCDRLNDDYMGDMPYVPFPVYGAWRCDVGHCDTPTFCEGTLRFRTKEAATKFGTEHYSTKDGGPGFRVQLHTTEVPEDELYVP